MTSNTAPENMKDHEIRALADRFGLTAMLHSKQMAARFFAFAREVERRAQGANKSA